MTAASWPHRMAAQIATSARPPTCTSHREVLAAGGRTQLPQNGSVRNCHSQAYFARRTSPACSAAMLNLFVRRAGRSAAAHRCMHAAAAETFQRNGDAAGELTHASGDHLDLAASWLSSGTGTGCNAGDRIMNMKVPVPRRPKVRCHRRWPRGCGDSVAPAAARQRGAAGARGALLSCW